MINTVGVIGTGNMGSALVKGWLRAEGAGIQLIVWDKIEAAAQRLVTPGRVSLAGSLDDLVARVDAVLVVVKPKDAAEVLGAIAPRLRDGQILISSMAGMALEQIRAVAGPGPCLFRVMPNLGVELGVGAVAVCPEPTTPATEVEAVSELLACLGVVRSVPESMLDAVTAVAGSGPAFLALAVEGLEDGAVAAGLPRATAQRAVRLSALATARLLELHSDSPADLRRERAGAPTDSAGMAALERRGVREAFRRATEAAAVRGGELRGAGAAQQDRPPDGDGQSGPAPGAVSPGPRSDR